jgi:maltose O-acetyltransferase
MGLNKSPLRTKTKVGQLLAQVVRDAGEPRSLLWAFTVNGLASGFAVPARVRTLVYRAMGMKIAYSVLVRPRVIFRDKAVSIGSGSTINYGCIFDNRSGVMIGRNVGVGVAVQFLNTDHEISDPFRRAGRSRWDAITIDDGVFIGSGAIILSGVHVKTGVVVAAGAVVNRDCEPHGVYAGVPAKRVKNLLGQSDG